MSIYNQQFPLSKDYFFYNLSSSSSTLRLYGRNEHLLYCEEVDRFVSSVSSHSPPLFFSSSLSSLHFSFDGALAFLTWKGNILSSFSFSDVVFFLENSINTALDIAQNEAFSNAFQVFDGERISSAVFSVGERCWLRVYSSPFITLDGSKQYKADYITDEEFSSLHQYRFKNITCYGVVYN